MRTATPTASDSHLTRRAVRGSSRAFEAIFERYHQELYRYCAAIVGNSADAQDAVQNAMVKVLRALPGEERRIELKPWLYRIAHNEAIEIVRRRLPVEEIDAESLLGSADMVEKVEARERLGRLLVDIAELSERQRGALVMRELSGLGFDQIGEALGMSASTARQTVYEARLSLRQLSEGREMDCAAATRALAKGDRRLLRGRKLRAHLRACESCRAYRAQLDHLGPDLALVAPLPATAAAGLLHGVLAGGGAAGAAAAGGGASVAGTAGAAAGKSLLSATALKAAAAVGVVVAIGVTAADQRGLIQIGSGHSLSQPPAKSAPPLRAGAAAGSSAPSAPDRARRDATVASGRGSGSAERSLSGARPADGTSAGAAPGSARREPEPRPSVPTPAGQAAPVHADNGRHLGQLKHPYHGHAAAADHGAESHGKSASAPGHTKAKHEAAPAKPPPGQAKKAGTGEEASGAAESDHPAHPGQPEGSAATAEPPAETHGKGGSQSSVE